MDTVSQKTFLDTLKADLPAGHHLLVAELLQKGVPAKAYTDQTLTGQWYVCVGASRNPKRRRRGDIAYVRALVIDDVGTKVNAKAIKVKPSWKIETSPGNFQWGYLLEWTDQLDMFDALNSALVTAGLQDKGAQGVNRIVRIPGSVNMKPQHNGWHAVVREWHPKRVQTLQALVDAFGLPLEKPQAKRESVDAGTKGMADPLFDWFNDRGMVRHAKSDGWYEIDCPFAHEHGGDPRTDAAYKPIGADNRGTRGFKCFHSHGEDSGAYAARVLKWVVEQGGPRCDKGETDRIQQSIKKLVAVMPKPKANAYTQVTLGEALGEVPKSALARVEETAKGGYAKVQLTTTDNVLAILTHLKIGLRYNMMTHRIDYTLPDTVDRARLEHTMIDGDLRMLLDTVWAIAQSAGLRNEKAYRDAIHSIAESDCYHPMDEWIRSKPWDGADHFAMLLHSVETPTPDVFKAFLWRWMLQCVEAVSGYARKPSSQKSGVLVLVGPQGIGKTRWLTRLAPDFSREGAQLHLSGFGARDTMHEALSRAIVELGELEITFGKSESGALKNFLSKTTDHYRMPYAAEWIERPRCTSFCGSVNDEGFLVDTSGSRRFWPVTVTRCFSDHGVDPQQLWAQVFATWAQGKQWWLTEEEEAMRVARAPQYEQVDAIAQTLKEEVMRREQRMAEGHLIACGLHITAIHRLLSLPLDRRSLSAGTAVLKGLLGNPRDLRDYDGVNRAWVFYVTTEEKAAHELDVLKPGYRLGPRPDLRGKDEE